jgi:drug/metabolite transporter (DMT)-like permease
MLAVVLALGSSLCWGVGDLLAGLAARRGPARAVTITGQLVGLGVAGMVVLSLGRPFPGIVAVAPALLAGIALALGTVAYFAALAGGTMSIVAPIAATSAVVPVVVGLLQGERPSVYQFLGAVLALAGVALASREPKTVLPTIEGPITIERRPAPAPAGSPDAPTAPAAAEEHARPETSRSPRPAPAPERGEGNPGTSTALAFLAAACFGLVLVGFSQAARHDPFWAPLGARMTSVLILAVVLAGRRGPWGLPGTAVAWSVLAGLLHVTAATFFSLASTRGLLSVVSVLSSLSAVVMVALAFVLLGERLGRSQGAGVLVAISGVIILVAG